MLRKRKNKAIAISCNHCCEYIRVAKPGDRREDKHFCSDFCKDNYRIKKPHKDSFQKALDRLKVL